VRLANKSTTSKTQENENFTYVQYYVLPYCLYSANFLKQANVNIRVKEIFSKDFFLLKLVGKYSIVWDIFCNPPMLNISCESGAVGAGTASHYGSRNTKMMRLLSAPQHCFKVYRN
jgi:hypothetical protein